MAHALGDDACSQSLTATSVQSLRAAGLVILRKPEGSDVSLGTVLLSAVDQTLLLVEDEELAKRGRNLLSELSQQFLTERHRAKTKASL